MGKSCCGTNPKRARPDFILWIGVIGVTVGYLQHLALNPDGKLGTFSNSVFEIMNQM